MMELERDRVSYKDPKPNECLAECLAHLLEIPISSVPNFSKMYFHAQPWHAKFNQILEEHGLVFRGTLDCAGGSWDMINDVSSGVDGNFIVNGTSSTEVSGSHSVVFKNGFSVFDPYIGGKGLSAITSVLLIERKGI